jgi:hypothetical protein
MERNLWLFELARAQAESEQQLSAELTTRAGLLAALVGLVAVGLTEAWHFHGRAWWLFLACTLLIAALVSLTFASKGMRYERPENIGKWDVWAQKEKAIKQYTEDQLNDAVVSQLFKRYTACVCSGMNSNDAKASRLNWAFGFTAASLFCLLLGLLFG